MADDQQFCLRWNEFQSNMVSSFKHLREEKSFTDVTLACDGQTCKAHKMVLSACSPYFKALLEVLSAAVFIIYCNRSFLLFGIPFSNSWNENTFMTSLLPELWLDVFRDCLLIYGVGVYFRHNSEIAG